MANKDLANHNKESYAYMSNGLVANIMQSYRGLYFRERILCGPPLSCMSDVPPHVEVIGVILSGEGTDEPEGDGSRFAMLAACDSQFQTIVEDSSPLMVVDDTLRTPPSCRSYRGYVEFPRELGLF